MYYAAAVTAARWDTQWDLWAGRAPAAFEADNVKVTGSGIVSLELRVAPDDYNFPGGAQNCNCTYESFTTGLLRSDKTVSPGSYIEVHTNCAQREKHRPKPPHAWFTKRSARLSSRSPNLSIYFYLVKTRFKVAEISAISSIWLQSETAEISVEIQGASSTNSSRSSVLMASTHFWNSGGSSENVTSVSFEVKSTSSFPLEYRVLGVDWSSDTVDFYLDGSLIGNLDTSSFNLEKPAHLMFSLETDPNAGLPNVNDLPASFKIDYVRVWRKGDGVSTLAPTTTTSGSTTTVYLGYTQPAGTQTCDRSKATSAGIKALKGKGHSFVDCANGCEAQFDCHYFTLSNNGWCFFYKTCDDFVDNMGQVTCWQRSSTPTTPTPSAIEGYTLNQTGKSCDTSIGNSKPADRSSLGGGGHSLEACISACNIQRSCRFFGLSEKGFCKMFAECGNTKSFSGNLYAKDAFRLFSVVEMCDKSALRYMSLGGGGYSLEECQAGCASQNTCSHINWYSSSGYCHLFTAGCSTTVAASGGSVTYARVGGALKPSLEGWSSSGLNRICKEGADGVELAPRSRLWGAGHSLEDCTNACIAQGDGCASVVFSLNKGYCKMYRKCAALKYAGKNGRVVYSLSDSSARNADGRVNPQRVGDGSFRNPGEGRGEETRDGTVSGFEWSMVVISAAAVGGILVIAFIRVRARRNRHGYEELSGSNDVDTKLAYLPSITTSQRPESPYEVPFQTLRQASEDPWTTMNGEYSSFGYEDITSDDVYEAIDLTLQVKNSGRPGSDIESEEEWTSSSSSDQESNGQSDNDLYDNYDNAASSVDSTSSSVEERVDYPVVDENAVQYQLAGDYGIGPARMYGSAGALGYQSTTTPIPSPRRRQSDL